MPVAVRNDLSRLDARLQPFSRNPRARRRLQRTHSLLYVLLYVATRSLRKRKWSKET